MIPDFIKDAFSVRLQTQDDDVQLGEREGTIAYKDIEISFERVHGCLRVFVTGGSTPIRRLYLNWRFSAPEGLRILGDAWERGYGDLEWRGIVPERVMPWYMLLNDAESTVACGVKTGAAAMCFWRADRYAVQLCLDVRNGAEGVILHGRRLLAAEVISMKDTAGRSSFRTAQEFCRRMCIRSREAGHYVYGSNNWYYAYGNSSHAQILKDADLLAELTEGNDPRPYLVIDDGWQLKHAAGYNGGPWHSGNARFPDMRRLACEIRERKLHPGIWYRPLVTDELVPEEWRLMRSQEKRFTVLDPSHPAVLEKVEHMTRTLVDWGYELIKHDFTTCDIFGRFGPSMNQTLTDDGWHFYDRSKTSAEIITGLYRAIRSGAEGDTVVLGCNTVSHLAAGLFELQRTGDDTSGREWERTRKMGVNTLAFRMPQHNAFYCCDADCAGVTAFIDWKLNKEWLRLLAVSGTPLFVSADPDTVTPEQKRELKAAFRTALEIAEPAEPINWQDTTCPDRWLTAKGEMNFRLPSAEA